MLTAEVAIPRPIAGAARILAKREVLVRRRDIFAIVVE